MTHLMTYCKKRGAFIVFFATLSVFALTSSGAHSASSNPDKNVTIQQLDKTYFLLLFGFVFFLPEIVELNLEPDGSFSLSSDLFVAPAEGNYEENFILLKANGSTGEFYDPDFEENIKIQYKFIGAPLGLRDFFILGIGSREFTFEDGLTVPEKFIFSGSGY